MLLPGIFHITSSFMLTLSVFYYLANSVLDVEISETSFEFEMA